jgi:hypothetical protein
LKEDFNQGTRTGIPCKASRIPEEHLRTVDEEVYVSGIGNISLISPALTFDSDEIAIWAPMRHPIRTVQY